MRNALRKLAILSFLLCLSPWSVGAEAEVVLNSLDELDAWLSDSPHAEGWRSYLMTSQLREELSKGDDADPVLISAVLERLERLDGSQSKRRLVGLRSELRSWVNRRRVARQQRRAGLLLSVHDRFSPIDAPRIKVQQAELRNSLDKLQTFLKSGSAKRETGWKAYIDWVGLWEAATADELMDSNRLTELARPFYEGHRGLELAPFVDVRESISALRRLALAKDSDQVVPQYNEQLSNIRSLLESASDELSASQLIELNARLNWLQQLQQASDVVRVIRDDFSQPNLTISASEALVAAAMTQPVATSQPVREEILGTDVRGTAFTQGVTSATVVPHSSSIAIQLQLSGVTTSRNVGYRSPVVIHSDSTTQVFGTKMIYFDGFRLSSQPASANCSTSTRIRAVKAERQGMGSRLIEKIARKKVAEQKSLSERIASQRAARRVSQSMDDRTSLQLAQANERMSSRIQTPLVKRNVMPRMVRSMSERGRVFMSMLFGRDNQLASMTSPPEVALLNPSNRLCIQVHESAIANSAVNYIGGLVLTDTRAAEVVKELTGNVPEQLSASDEAWSITFDRLQPVLVEFRDGKITIRVTSRALARGDKPLNRTMEVSATYDPTIVDGKLVMIRDGDVRVIYPDNEEDQRLTIGDITYRDFVETKFSGLFEETIQSQGIQLPEQLQSVAPLNLIFVAANDGWLSLAWE